MAVLYSNFIDGTLSADITSAATTVSATVFSSLPAVSGGDEIWLTLDPDATAGAPEIVKVTAHTAASNDVTVDRAQQGTSARGHLTGVRVTNPATRSDLAAFLTSAADMTDGEIPTAKLADGAVTAAKIADGTITVGKLDTSIAVYSTGDVKSSIRSTAEPGWLMLDGSTVSGADSLHPALWALAPASWKSGSDLVLPDMSDRIVQGGGTLGATDGSNTSTALVNHTHSVSGSTSSDTHSHSGKVEGSAVSRTMGTGSEWDSVPNNTASVGSDSHSHSVSGTAATAGTGSSFSLEQAALRLNFFIKT